MTNTKPVLVNALKTVRVMSIAVAGGIVGLVVALVVELHGVAPAARAENLAAVAQVLLAVAEIVKVCLGR